MSSSLISRAFTNALRQVGRSKPSLYHRAKQREASSKHPRGFVPPKTEDLVELRERVQEFTRREIAEEVAAKTDKTNEFPKNMWEKLGGAGFLGITADEDYGGLAMGYQAHCVVMEEISRASGSIGLSYAAHSQLCINQLSLNGTEAQKGRFLPDLISGHKIGALAMSEHSAGSDVVSMKTTAKATDGGWLLNGTKMWITNVRKTSPLSYSRGLKPSDAKVKGPDAHYIIVYAKTDPSAGSKGITAFVVDSNTSGLSCARKLDKLGMRGSNTGELIFEDVFVPKENLLGKVNRGVKVLMEGLDIERLVLSAGPLGYRPPLFLRGPSRLSLFDAESKLIGIFASLMQASLDITLPYTHTRHQFSTPIAHNQLVQAKLADMHTKLSASRAYTYATARTLDSSYGSPDSRPDTKDCAGAILFAAERATECALDAIQLMGGMGYMNEVAAGRILRDAKLYEIGAGTSEVRRIVIGRAFNREWAER